MTDRHRRGARPTQRMRTPHSCSWSRRRRITSRLKPMRKRTSSGERRQFSVEKAYADRCVTPTSMAPATTSSSDASPASWPLVRGSPRALAHRPLPSMTIATCLGSRAGAMTGGVAPDGCGKGLAYMGLRSVGIEFAAGSGALDEAQRPQPSLDVPLEEGGDEAVALPTAALVACVGDVPVAGQ